jgi:predicted GNAT superfamily acetyltransferase
MSHRGRQGTRTATRIGDAPYMPTTPPELRDLAPSDLDHVLALNGESVEKLSPLDAHALDALLAQAALARVAVVEGEVAGFVVALREGRDYPSENYRWFASRYPRFVYVDRVVVGAGYRGRGIARALYADVFAHARREGIERIACEYDIEPPNPASARFHAAQGFREVGTQVLGTGKRVSLQIVDVTPRG